MTEQEAALYERYAASALTGLLAGPLGNDVRGLQKAIAKAGAKDAMDLFAINAHDIAKSMIERSPK